jgi:hypothetical protein
MTNANSASRMAFAGTTHEQQWVGKAQACQPASISFLKSLQWWARRKCAFAHPTSSRFRQSYARASPLNPARSLHKNHACVAQSRPLAGFDPGARRVSFR